MRCLLVAGIAIPVLFGAGTIMNYPPPTCDEALYGDTAVSLLTRGIPAWTVFPEGDRFGRDINVVHMGRLYTLGLSAVFSVLGINLFAGRVYSIVGWLLAGYLTYLIGAKFYGRRIGVAAALVFLTSIKAFLTSHLTRPESWTTAAILLAIYLMWVTIERRRTVAMSFFAGLAAVATLDFHANGFAFMLGLSLVFFLEIGLRQKQLSLVAGYSAGVLIGGIALAAAHAWPNPQVAWQQLTSFSLGYTSLGRSGAGWTQNIQSMLPFLRTAYWTAGGPLGLAEAGLGIAGLTVAAMRRTRSDSLLSIVLVTSMAVYALVFSQRFVQYGVLWSPLLFILGMAAIDEFVRRFSARLNRWPSAGSLAFGLAAAGLVAVNLAGDAWLVYRYRGGNFAEMNAALQDFIPPGTRVLADPDWWWGLRQGRVFMSDEYIIALSQDPERAPGEASPGLDIWVLNAMRELRPDYILIDSAISCQDADGPGWAALHIYATSYCQLVGKVDGAWLGDRSKKSSLLAQSTRVYRCEWGN